MGMLEGKVAFITGGASGIGKGTALRFAREGAKVAIVDMQPEEGEKARVEIARVGDREALFFVTDVSDPQAVKSAMDQAVEKFGRLDIVFANAGINGVWAPLEELEPEEWDKTLAINLKGTFLTVHYAVPYLKKAGAARSSSPAASTATARFPIPARRLIAPAKPARWPL